MLSLMYQETLLVPTLLAKWGLAENRFAHESREAGKNDCFEFKPLNNSDAAWNVLG